MKTPLFSRITLYRWLTVILVGVLAACSSTSKHTPKPSRSHVVKPVRITHINQYQGGQELMLQSLGLIGTPYRWGGSSTASGFDCSGMIQYVYQTALGVRLPRTSRDMAAASQTISPNQLKTGDLVFFNTSGSGISHVGLYLGNGEFLHAPRSGSTVKTEKLSHPYYAKRLVKAGRYFVR